MPQKLLPFFYIVCDVCCKHIGNEKIKQYLVYTELWFIPIPIPTILKEIVVIGVELKDVQLCHGAGWEKH